MKSYEELTQQELAIELLKNQQQSAKNSRIAAICTCLIFIVVTIVSVILVPKAQNTMKKVRDTMTHAEATLTQAETTLNEIEKTVVSAQQSLEEIDTMVGNVNTLVEENTEGVSSIIDKVTELDIDGLNKSIQDLSNVVTPLAGLFRR